MSILELENDPAAVNVAIANEKLVVDLVDGRVLLVPLEWYPRLKHATEAERQYWQLLGDGYAIEWPAIDEHIGIEGLVAGHKSGESEKSFREWLAERSP
jgi:hypothetical protein